MRAWGWSLLAAAVLPWTGAVESPLLPLPQQAPCAVAIDVRVEAPLQWGRLEWRLFTREVEGAWTPYGLTICWEHGGHGCEGFTVRLRVFVAETLPPAAVPTAPPVVGRIRFQGNEPGTEIFLSLEGGRFLVSHASLGGRRVADWPAGIAERLLPAVMGRTLAHELGHFLLASRQHSRSGLMAAQFRPDDVTFGGGSGFRLSPEEATAMRVGCVAGRLNAGPQLPADGSQFTQ
jgi:hypothetical protein